MRGFSVLANVAVERAEKVIAADILELRGDHYAVFTRRPSGRRPKTPLLFAPIYLAVAAKRSAFAIDDTC
jgi:hypothetical protein